MRGIDILTQQEIYSVNKTLLVLCALISITAVGFALVIESFQLIRNRTSFWGSNKIRLHIFLVIVVGSIMNVLIGDILATVFGVPTGKYEYTARIEEQVSLTEFYEKYEIISVDGDIWTFRDKE